MRRRVKNTIIKTSGWVAGVICLYSACCIDADSWTPTIVFSISSAYLTVLAYANGMMERSYLDD